jgi:hypothetical protein
VRRVEETSNTFFFKTKAARTATTAPHLNLMLLASRPQPSIGAARSSVATAAAARTTPGAKTKKKKHGAPRSPPPPAAPARDDGMRNFYGCYLLLSHNPDARAKTYVGCVPKTESCRLHLSLSPLRSCSQPKTNNTLPTIA